MHKICFLFFLGLFVAACATDTSSDDLVVGSDYLGINNKVILIDTMTVSLSTINFDSLVTSAKSRIFVGNYEDPVFGKVNSESYMEFGSTNYKIGDSESDTETTSYVYDSIALILKYDKYVYGDTTRVQTFKVRRLLENIKPNSGDTNLYNNTSFNYSPDVLGSATFLPKPVSKDSLNITLNNDFGTELYQKLKTNQITNYSEFTDYFKGIAITSDASASVVGFTTDAVIRLYYSKLQDQEAESSYKDFTILVPIRQFNHITLDRSETVLQNLPGSDSAILSTQTNNSAYIQSGTGIACRIDFPNLKSIRNIAEKGTIVDAELLMKPVRNSYSKAYPLKDSLVVYESDKLNQISATLADANGSQIYGKLNMATDEFNENIAYSVKIGNFLQQQLFSSNTTSSLIFTLPNLSNGVDRILLGDQAKTENKLKLKIYYISY